MLPRFNLLAISNRASLPVPFDDWLLALGRAGVGAVQLREKDLDDRANFELASRARRLLPPTVQLLVNGRVDLGLAAGADGVHLPADGMPLAPLRRRFGPGLLIGCSTHRVEEVVRAQDDGADYAVFGPIYESPGKGAPVGLGELAKAAAVGLPVYALGGVTLERFRELAGTGAAGIAAIRLFQDISGLTQVARIADEHFRRPVRRP